MVHAGNNGIVRVEAGGTGLPEHASLMLCSGPAWSIGDSAANKTKTKPCKLIKSTQDLVHYLEIELEGGK